MTFSGDSFQVFILDFVGQVVQARACIAYGRFLMYSRLMEPLTDTEILRLSPQERWSLITQLWDRLENHQLPLTQGQQTELERRLTSLDRDRGQGVTWAALKAELEQRCP